MCMFVLMNLTMMQGHIGSEKAQIQRSATTQAIRIKLATTVDHFLRDNDLDFAYVYLDCPPCFFILILSSLFPGFFLLTRLALARPLMGKNRVD